MRIKEFRKRKNMTQRDLADHLHVTNITVSRWESGIQCPSIETFVVLADFFGCKVDDLVRDSNPTPPPVE